MSRAPHAAVESAAGTLQRIALRVCGRVQGVGFRPCVYRLAKELALGGWVRNDGSGVEIEIEGHAPALAAFRKRLATSLPPLARIDAIEEQARAPTGCGAAFAIVGSRASAPLAEITPDAAVCGNCLDDLFDARDRRYRYAFINCTHCGPRYTISLGPPYDRARTSMRKFAMCSRCAAEYADPADRRFHAQPDACPACGPRLARLDDSGRRVDSADVIADALDSIRAGRILAIKGLGGFHLVCDARNAAAVARLRTRKQRDEKPFAVMLANRASLGGLAGCDEREAVLLGSAAAPIVLLAKAAACDQQLAGVAPGISRLGVMLPHTPLHWLLFHEAAGRPAAADWRSAPQELALVMTSANPHDEPLVIDELEAVQRLAGIADDFLTHDRDIVTRCDDSVMQVDALGAAFIRRARGYTPAAIALGRDGPTVIAFGAHLKNSVCVLRGDRAFVSQHIGDLDTAASRAALGETAQRLLDLLGAVAERVACDRHPDYYSSQFAQRFAAEHGVAAIEVQHHHAHIAAVVAEHGIDEAVLGLALDGYGMGDDGEAWGGELLRVEGAHSARLGRLKPLALPGGDRAAREPWRMAVAALAALGIDRVPPRIASPQAVALLGALRGGLKCPPTSSAGRLFDAAAGLLGIRPMASFEGQAAMLLEACASEFPALPDAHATLFRIDDQGIDFLPLLAYLTDCHDVRQGAATFHAGLAAGLAAWVARTAQAQDITTVALGGGCFVNRLLTGALRARLTGLGMRVLTARQLPPNDGGIALGQAWVARHTNQPEPNER